MRITIIVPHIKIAGGIRVMLNYANVFATQGDSVLVLVREESFKERTIKKIWGSRVPWFPQLHASISVQHRSGEDIQKYVSHADKEEAIIADSWSIGALVGSCHAKAQTFLIIQHDERLFHGDAGEVRDVYKLPMKKIVVASWLKEMLRSDFNQDAYVSLNSYEKEYFFLRPTQKKNNKVRILILDHSYAWKGTEASIRIVRNIQKEFPNIELVGFGSRRDEVGELYDEYHYKKVNNDLAEVMSSADIFLCGSEMEGFGLPSLEAMACGAALVTYDNGGSQDFARDGETAFVASRGDRDMLEKKLREALLDGEKRLSIAQKGSDLAREWPTWEQQGKALRSHLCQT